MEPADSDIDKEDHSLLFQLPQQEVMLIMLDT